MIRQFTKDKINEQNFTFTSLNVCNYLNIYSKVKGEKTEHFSVLLIGVLIGTTFLEGSFVSVY